MVDSAAFSGQMGEFQKLRVTVVILLSQENSKLLSRRQRVAGKENEVMCAERDLQQGGATPGLRSLLDAPYLEETAARLALHETEQEIAKMETMIARIDADISALCQS